MFCLRGMSSGIDFIRGTRFRVYVGKSRRLAYMCSCFVLFLEQLQLGVNGVSRWTLGIAAVLLI